MGDRLGTWAKADCINVEVGRAVTKGEMDLHICKLCPVRRVEPIVRPSNFLVWVGLGE